MESQGPFSKGCLVFFRTKPHAPACGTAGRRSIPPGAAFIKVCVLPKSGVGCWQPTLERVAPSLLGYKIAYDNVDQFGRCYSPESR